MAGNGDLVCYFSDERPSANGYNQVLAHVVSTDGGASWGSRSTTSPCRTTCSGRA